MWGQEQLRFWTVGGQAKLSWVMPSTNAIWTPFVAATFDQEFGFSHTLNIPVQLGQIADTVDFSGAQTFFGVRAGLQAQLNSGWNVGLQGSYQESDEFRIASVQAFARYYFGPGAQSDLVRNFTLPQQR